MASLPWNVPLFKTAGVPAWTATVGGESRDAISLEESAPLTVELDRPSVCRVGCASRERCPGGIVEGFVDDQPVFGLRALTEGAWHDVEFELPEGRSILRFSAGGGARALLSHPVIRPIQHSSGAIDRPRAVVVIVVDGVAADMLGLYGNTEARTPSVDAFFAPGLVYEQAFSQSEWTYPSLYSLMTGKHTLGHGCFERYLGGGLGPSTTGTLAQELTERGYVTMGFSMSKMFHPAFNAHLGFQRFFYEQFPVRLSHARVTERAIAHLESHRRFNNFVWLDYLDTHAPWLFHSEITEAGLEPFRVVDPHEAYERFTREAKTSNGEPLFASDAVRALRRRYAARIHELDVSLGHLFGYLERTGLSEESLVILLADHGDQFRRGRQPLLCDSRTHVPLLLRGPSVPQGRVAVAAAAGIDILPTILRLVDQQEPALPRDGRPLPPFGPEREWVVSESVYEGVYQAAVRTREFVWHVSCPYDRDAKRVRLDHPQAVSQLFERANEEACRDVAAEHPDEVSRLQRALAEHLGDYADSALRTDYACR
jgi:arylsulfatase A-like enzyme